MFLFSLSSLFLTKKNSIEDEQTEIFKKQAFYTMDEEDFAHGFLSLFSLSSLSLFSLFISLFYLSFLSLSSLFLLSLFSFLTRFWAAVKKLWENQKIRETFEKSEQAGFRVSFSFFSYSENNNWNRLNDSKNNNPNQMIEKEVNFLNSQKQKKKIKKKNISKQNIKKKTLKKK